MGKTFKWLGEKLLSRGVDGVLTSIVAGLAWFYTESHWAGWRSYVMTALAGALAFFLCVFYRQVHGQQAGLSSEERLREDLQRLDQDETVAIVAFRNKNTVEFPSGDTVVAGLVAREILVPVPIRRTIPLSEMGVRKSTGLFSLAPAARKYLEEHGW